MSKSSLQRLAIVGLLLLQFGVVEAGGPRYRAEKGLAMAVHNLGDIDNLGVGWWYVWGWCDESGCVPMVRRMEPPPSCPPILLVGNEPNAREPYGAPTIPRDAVLYVTAIEAQCPQTKLVVGNVSADDWSRAGGQGSGYRWLAEFLQEYRLAAGHRYRGALGAHCYTQQLAGYCTGKLLQMRRLYSGEMWVTEFNVLSGDPVQFRRLLTYIARNFTRYAVYTNRQPHTGQGWEIAQGVELVNADGSLAPTGRVYMEQ